ncbi:MAG: helix-turn-helix transcriptional regulator [Agathobacter sp.]|nr:helix-turn-helix transcriptional regulator [Agathobacter sp.]
MKRSDVIKYIDTNISRDELRKRMFEKGFENLYQEIEMESPTVDAHQDISYTGDYVIQHSHLYYEIIYCTQGNIEYLLGVQRYQIQSGDIIIAPPGIIHCPILPKHLSTPYKRYVLCISSSFAETLRNANSEILDFREAIVLRTMGTRWEYLKDFFSHAIEESEERLPGWEICLGGNTAQLVALIGRALHEINTVKNTPKHTLLENILDYMQNNLSQKLSIDETAKHFHISSSTLTHLFHRELGISFYRCLTQRRLVEAKNLIAKEYSMEDVAILVGFQEYSAFYRAFKSEYGISPMQYKKLIYP